MRAILRATLAFLILGSFAVAAESRPNIVCVLFDDMGYGEPVCYRASSPFRTPALDRLAREGMRFTDAHSAAAVCTPTRYGLLTGRYPWRIGQYGVLTTYSPPIIPRERLTIASLLKQHGYQTACLGKWHLGLTWDGKPGRENSVPVGATFADGPRALGFDTFWGFTHARNIGTVLHQDRVANNVQAIEVQPLLAAKAVEYIRERTKSGKPFFLYLPLCTPHTPIVPAAEFVGQGGVKGTKADAAYADWLYQGDWVLGQVLEALDRAGAAENTLVIATSDNGAAGRSYEPLRAAKSSIYEGGHRVPFVARWPARVKAGAVCDVTICLNDVLATCAEIVEATLPADAAEDSVSLLPLLSSQAAGPRRESTVHQSPAGDLAVRQGSWKLILFNRGHKELYDLQSDLSEARDVSADHPQVVERLTALLQSHIDDGRSTPGLRQRNGVDVPLEGNRRRSPR